MKKTMLTLLIACCFLSCNEVIDEVEVPPYTTFPNPFVDQLGIYFDTNRYPNSAVSISILDGSEDELIMLETVTSSPLTLDVSKYDEGMYFIEVAIDGTTFNSTVLKAK
ncbi:MAG: T9SS type A sorting domain-containing protein [Bacteroidota bacterium]